MLVLDRKAGTWQDCVFRDFPSFLFPGDCLVLNDSRVLPSRLLGHRPGTTGKIEVFLTKPLTSDFSQWEALVKPGRKMGVGETVVISEELSVEVMGRGEHGERTVRLISSVPAMAALEKAGHVPLPPYIRRPDSAADRERYQTVFAATPGSVAAPTAGLHFTPEVLQRCEAAGAEIARVTLHVGLGTFQPIREDNLEDVKLHTESFEVSSAAREAMDRARRVVAAGTTSVRSIESDPGSNQTNIFIKPGFAFRRTGAMLTNFHLPQSSLLVLVSAFAGKELVLDAYQHAVREGYRFFSYGDCMFIR